jgi:Protein of unknown function (DUF3485)
MPPTEAMVDHPGDSPTRAPAPARSRPATWAWAAVACALLGASGVVRTVQERRHNDEASYIEACPFPLESIPRTLGAWKLKENAGLKLDPQTMRITGGSDHVLRTYVDELTGVSLVVLVLFGPAAPVLPHIPEVCYPSSGYSANLDPSTVAIRYRAGDPSGREVEHEALFRSGIYEKAGGLTTLREESYHSFRLEGNWSPDVGSGKKLPRRSPGVFKVQVQRLMAPVERRGKDDPIEQFLGVLIPEIERRIAEGPKAPAG